MTAISTHQVTVPNGDLQIAAYMASPTEAGLYPAVIVVQEIFGVNAHIRDVTERIAREGYVAIAPAIYQRQAPDFETGYTMEAVQEGKRYKEQTQTAELLSDLQATINYLYELPQVKTTGVGLIGFCFGGHVVYLGATLPDVKATASFYGAGIVNWNPGNGQPTITRTPDIQGTLYAFFGGQDASIPLSEVEQIQQALQNHHINHQVLIYPEADHGFFCDQRGSYHPSSAADAWQKVLELYRGHLN